MFRNGGFFLMLIELVIVVLLVPLLVRVIVLIGRKRRGQSVPSNALVLSVGCGMALLVLIGGYFFGFYYYLKLTDLAILALALANAVAAIVFANTARRRTPVVTMVTWPCARWHPNAAGSRFCIECGGEIVPPPPAHYRMYMQ